MGREDGLGAGAERPDMEVMDVEDPVHLHTGGCGRVNRAMVLEPHIT